MTEHKTFPGKVYTVSCAEDTTVVLPDPLGVKEAVVLECTAGQQLHVTATAGRLETSSDQAIVTELFKLAPCRGVAAMMLLRKAGGWLPRGFTELEYLESSGTQYIVAPHLFATNNDKASGVFDVSPSIEGTQVVFGSRKAWKQQALAVAVVHNDVSYAQFAAQANSFDFEPFFNTKTALDISQEGFYINGQWISAFSYASFTSIYPYYLFTTRNDSTIDARMMVGKCYAFSVERSGAKMLRLIPALRKSDGVPGMWDAVSKQFFTNAGTGVFGYRVKGAPAAFSLRDPHRVAPSGVWAKLKSENELEIVADTEMEDGEPLGYTWYANTGEAYEHFGIVIQEDFN